MAKSLRRRVQVLKLKKKWESLLKRVNPERDLKCVTFGRVFSRDPFDCGNPKCPLCSYDKVLHPKANRQKSRKEERSAALDLEQNETSTDQLSRESDFAKTYGQHNRSNSAKPCRE